MSEQNENQTEKNAKKPTAPKSKKVVTPVTEPAAQVEKKEDVPPVLETEKKEEVKTPVVETPVVETTEEVKTTEEAETKKEVDAEKTPLEAYNEIKESNKNIQKTDSFDPNLGSGETEKKEDHVFEKPVHPSEKAHYENIIKSNKTTIASLRTQVFELREENEKLKNIKE